jgi:hypothetical protein
LEASRQKLVKPYLKNKTSMVGHMCNPSFSGFQFEARRGKSQLLVLSEN